MAKPRRKADRARKARLTQINWTNLVQRGSQTMTKNHQNPNQNHHGQPKTASLPPPAPQPNNPRGDNRSTWDILQAIHRHDMAVHEHMRQMAAEMDLLARKLASARSELFGANVPGVMPATPDEDMDATVHSLANKFAAGMGR